MTNIQHLWTIRDICEITNGQITDRKAANKTDGIITGISIDSREIKTGNLFVALPGTVSDGHKFLAAAQSAGAVAALVSKIDRELDLPQICVSDCLSALRQLGVASCARFGGIQFGITGSVGKTGSKEMLRQPCLSLVVATLVSVALTIILEFLSACYRKTLILRYRKWVLT